MLDENHHHERESAIVIPNDAYDANALKPLLSQLELSPDTISSDDFWHVRVPIQEMATVALAHQDIDAFRSWKKYAEDLSVARLSAPENESLEHDKNTATELLMGLRFLGTLGGDMECSQELHHELDLNPDRLGDIVVKCSDYNVDPTPWIDTYAASPDLAATHWSHFYEYRKKHFAKKGEYPTGDALHFAGTQTLIENAINGTTSAETTLTVARSVFELMDDQQKAQFAARYLEALHHADDRSSFTYGSPAAATILASPAVPQATKQGIYENCKAEREHLASRLKEGADHWEEIGLRLAVMHYDEIEVAHTAATTLSPNKIIELVSDLSKGEDVEDTSVRRSHDRLCGAAATVLIESGNDNEAATLIANINGSDEWATLVDRFAYRDGDLSALQHEDQFQAMAAPQGLGGEPSEQPNWQGRASILKFHQAMQQKDFAAAKEAVIAAADADRSMGHITHTPIPRYVDRLINAAPDTAADIATRIPHITDDDSTFITYNVPEAIARNTEVLERNLGWHEYTTYFKEYAKRAVAQPQIVRAIQQSLIM